MITVSLENNLDSLLELVNCGIFERDYMEVDPRGKAGIPFDLDVNRCKALLECGQGNILIARNNEGEPIGYLIYTTTIRDLFASVQASLVVAMFVEPEYRRTRAFKLLLDTAMRVATMQGSKTMELGVMPNGVNLEKRGYIPTNMTYIKLLQEDTL